MPDQARGGATPLFEEFDPPTAAAWRAAVEATLNGRPLASLTAHTVEGIDLPLLLRQEDVANIPALATAPGQPPYLRGRRPEGYLQQPWRIAQETASPTPQQCQAVLRHDLARGQTAVHLAPDEPTRLGLDPDQAPPAQVGRGGVSLATAADLVTALAEVDLATTPLYLQTGPAAAPLAALLVAALAEMGHEASALGGALGADPLGELAARGRLPQPLAGAYDDLAALVSWAEGHAPAFAILTVHDAPYVEAGGGGVHALAAALATGVAYLRALRARGVAVDTTAAHLHFSFSLGGDFFLEIARLRAARRLWAHIVPAFGGRAAAQTGLVARTARRNQTVTDPHVNMLRVTTAALAAVLGGVDALHVAPFDAVARPPDDFSRRLARNVQLILQTESQLTRPIDPAGGSWTVEWLTDQVARRAWAQFQEIEAAGGMAAALEAGLVQAQVTETAALRGRRLATRQDVLVGANQYAPADPAPPPADDTDYVALAAARAEEIAGRRPPATDLAPVDFAAAVAAARAGATLGQLAAGWRSAGAALPVVTPLPARRAAEPFEALQAWAAAYTARNGRRPRVYLANLGPPRQHRARADFAREFFAVGGFEIVDPPGSEAPEAAVAAAADGAPAVVICGPDNRYPAAVAPLVNALRRARPQAVVILAGNPPEQTAAHRAAGVDAFIFQGADCLALNRWLQETVDARS